RERILENFVKITKIDLYGSMKREQSKLRQSFYARFEEEIKQAEEYGKERITLMQSCITGWPIC
ncbi:MAG: hypothetical protein ACJ72S_09060, partial [Nitrososphaeraceae archaeon]